MIAFLGVILFALIGAALIASGIVAGWVCAHHLRALLRMGD